MLRLAASIVLAFAMLGFTQGSGASERIFRHSGITLRYPRGWFASNEPLTAVTNPVQRLVLSSYRLSPAVPYADGFASSPSNVAAVLMEDLPPYNSGPRPPRPRRFLLGRFVRLENFAGNRWTAIDFTDHRRVFVLFVGLGAKARPALARAALSILDGLVIARRTG